MPHYVAEALKRRAGMRASSNRRSSYTSGSRPSLDPGYSASQRSHTLTSSSSLGGPHPSSLTGFSGDSYASNMGAYPGSINACSRSNSLGRPPMVLTRVSSESAGEEGGSGGAGSRSSPASEIHGAGSGGGPGPRSGQDPDPGPVGIQVQAQPGSRPLSRQVSEVRNGWNEMFVAEAARWHGGIGPQPQRQQEQEEEAGAGRAGSIRACESPPCSPRPCSPKPTNPSGAGGQARGSLTLTWRTSSPKCTRSPQGWQCSALFKPHMFLGSTPSSQEVPSFLLSSDLPAPQAHPTDLTREGTHPAQATPTLLSQSSPPLPRPHLASPHACSQHEEAEDLDLPLLALGGGGAARGAYTEELSTSHGTEQSTTETGGLSPSPLAPHMSGLSGSHGVSLLSGDLCPRPPGGTLPSRVGSGRGRDSGGGGGGAGAGPLISASGEVVYKQWHGNVSVLFVGRCGGEVGGGPGA